LLQYDGQQVVRAGRSTSKLRLLSPHPSTLTLRREADEMTAQASDSITYLGDSYPLFSEPLESYFDKGHPRPPFQAPHTACWRGYIATWEIIENKLYLVDMEAWLDNKEVKLSAVFPRKKKPILSKWFNGVLRLQKGEMLNYVHMGYASTFEQEILITVEHGVVKAVETLDNVKRLPLWKKIDRIISKHRPFYGVYSILASLSSTVAFFFLIYVVSPIVEGLLNLHGQLFVPERFGGGFGSENPGLLTLASHAVISTAVSSWAALAIGFKLYSKANQKVVSVIFSMAVIVWGGLLSALILQLDTVILPLSFVVLSVASALFISYWAWREEF
jgi:hypothetical protein